MTPANPRRAIPSVERLLRSTAVMALLERFRRERVVGVMRAQLDEIRASVAAGARVPSDEAIQTELARRLEEALEPSMTRVVNATGIVLHTNLGRAPLAEAAVTALVEAARGPVNLEMDLATGRRGQRDDHVMADLLALTGAEAGLVVNNNAAAVLLVLNSLAMGREVVVSRGELVEIGGSFRMPDVMSRSGARLREVGTTNRTHPEDYRSAIGPSTALLMKVHTSNYRVMGFTAAVELGELVAIGRGAGVPVVEDLGSGALVDLTAYGIPREPIVGERIAAGADLVTFSGDKLLGGPQAGIVVGRRDLVVTLAANPIRRALRADKLTLAALGATLRLHRHAPDLPRALPVLRWLTRPLAEMEAIGRLVGPELAARLGADYRVTLVESEAEVGSGSVPTVPLPSRALKVEHPRVSADGIAARLRGARPPVVGRIRDGHVLLDLRGIFTVADLAIDLD